MIAAPSTAKFARFLENNNVLHLVQSENQSLQNSEEDAHIVQGFTWLSQNPIEKGEEWANYRAESYSHTIVVAATALNFESVSEILSELAIQKSGARIVKNAYHLAFDKMVLNIECNIDSKLTSPAQISMKLKELSELFFIDIFVKPSVSLKQKGLVVFDMDSTLIEMECIDEIAKLAGVGEAVAEVTERAMQGEIAFTESLHHRVACLEGVNIDALMSIRKRLPFMPGFVSLMNELKRNEWKIAIASGGFTYFADYIKALFDLDYATSNTLEVKDNKLTGKVLGKVIDAQAKADTLLSLAKENNISVTNTIAVGDGANDLVMMSVAGTGIAFRAKHKVQAKAANSIRFSGLEAVLYLLG
jgi:phosphoserine phosphatase